MRNNIDAEQRTLLLQIARQSIAYGLKNFSPPVLDVNHFSIQLQLKGASFVTLKIAEHLRGCIGTVKRHQALVLDVNQNAFKAAFKDPRFLPLKPEEFAQLKIEISLLSHLLPMPFENEDKLLKELKPFEDGLVVEQGNKRGLFLPTVWHQLPQPKDFWQALKHKAHISNPDDTIKLYRFNTVIISE